MMSRSGCLLPHLPLVLSRTFCPKPKVSRLTVAAQAGAMPLVAGRTEARPRLGAWLACLKPPQLPFASPRDEAAFALFVSNNTRLSAARVRCVTVLVWAVSLLQLVDHFWRSPLARRGVAALAR